MNRESLSSHKAQNKKMEMVYEIHGGHSGRVVYVEDLLKARGASKGEQKACVDEGM